MQYVTTLLVLGNNSAAAEGVRGMQLGEPCDKAAVIEPALGSRVVEISNGASFMHFAGEYSGEAADIVYLCEQNRLTEQVITIGADNREHAYRLADAIRATALKEFGAPAHDGLALNYAQKLWYSWWGVDGDVMLQSTIWNVDTHEVFLWVTRDAGDTWGVRYSQSAPSTLIADNYAGIQ